MRCKYIVGLALDDVNNRRLEATLFSDTFRHVDAAVAFGYGDNVVSAGFYALHQQPDATGEKRIAVEVYGYSETLKIGASDMDQYYVERALGLVREDRERNPVDYRKACDILEQRRQTRLKERNTLGRR